jgi:hypothetical protein
MSYAYSYETNSVSKWDTIQEDVSDAYAYLDEELNNEEEEEEDIFGFSKSIQIDHLSDEQIDELLTTIEWN